MAEKLSGEPGDLQIKVCPPPRGVCEITRSFGGLAKKLDQDQKRASVPTVSGADESNVSPLRSDTRSGSGLGARWSESKDSTAPKPLT